MTQFQKGILVGAVLGAIIATMVQRNQAPPR